MLEPDPDQSREGPQRKRLEHFERPGPRFLTFSCYNRLPLLGTARLRSAYCAHVESVRASRGFHVIAYCVMPEHVHIIVDPLVAQNPVSKLAFELKKPFAQLVLARWRVMNAPVLPSVTDARGRQHFWLHSAGFDRNVRAGTLQQKVHYVHLNPVERGLCGSAVDWEWSSARDYQRKGPGPVQVRLASDE